MPTKPLVAIVDDDESIRVTTKDLLESAGLNAAAFASAEDFLSSGLLPSVSCAIADMRMPGMSGLALHEHLLASGNPISTILITAYPDELVRARALQAGVVAYLTKPFTDDELLGCISSAVRPGQRSV
ncbi:response regulator transcription factor [Caenimonas soli]|uniref:response regulator transcription factor n=1 Tax=Caenimonas soli TaxID=2735555 RepID=UPI001552897B|nr:response regulator [Caenimonas soli]NPC54831.1 response regulator [Caenimonas soli]